MDRWRAALALVLAFGFVGAANARSASAETILIRFRFPYAICVGVCPNFEMRVSRGGEVITRNLFTHRSCHFRATPAKLSAFRQALNAVRPAGEMRLDSKCEAKQPDGTPDPLADDPRSDDFEVRWTGGRSEARLTGCDSGHLSIRVAVQNALRALGVDPYSGWDKRAPCGPGKHLEPDEEANRAWDAAHPGAKDNKTPRLSVSVCRP